MRSGRRVPCQVRPGSLAGNGGSGARQRRFMASRWLWPLAACLLCSACARLPDVNYLKAPINAPAAPSVVDGKGILSERAASSVLARRLGHSKVDANLLAGLEEAATGRPLIAGNKVTLLFDGPKTIAAMMAAVSEAKDSINLETYLFDQDPLGLKFADLLMAKRKAGVQVNIIYDCVGTLGTPQAFFDRLQAAGIQLLPFHPVSPLHRLGHWRINNRDHRKILVVDGNVAFAGRRQHHGRLFPQFAVPVEIPEHCRHGLARHPPPDRGSGGGGPCSGCSWTTGPARRRVTCRKRTTFPLSLPRETRFCGCSEASPETTTKFSRPTFWRSRAPRDPST